MNMNILELFHTAEHSFRDRCDWVALKPMEQTVALLEIATKVCVFDTFFLFRRMRKKEGMMMTMTMDSLSLMATSQMMKAPKKKRYDWLVLTTLEFSNMWVA